MTLEIASSVQIWIQYLETSSGIQGIEPTEVKSLGSSDRYVYTVIEKERKAAILRFESRLGNRTVTLLIFHFETAGSCPTPSALLAPQKPPSRSIARFTFTNNASAAETWGSFSERNFLADDVGLFFDGISLTLQ